MKNTLAFIGFGKMSNAICKGAIQSGFIAPENICAFDINETMLQKKSKELNITPIYDIKEVFALADNILIGTKPFVIKDILAQIKQHCAGKLIISILAGITLEFYEKSLTDAKIVRVMPNTPAMVNAGMSVVCGGKKSSADDVDFVYNLFSKLGRAIILDESKINAVTGVSGSGPAFYYYIIDAIARAGEKIGLDYDTALKLSAQTALGASKMILNSGLAPDKLIEAVTTPGGTTAEGNKVLNGSDICDVLYKTVLKTYEKAVEMGKNS